MLALPCAVSKARVAAAASIPLGTGILLGASLFCLVALLTFVSCTIIVRYAAAANVCSYGELVTQKFGRRGSILLQCAITVHVSGVMVGYNVIIADMLVGSAPNFTGMLPTVLNRHDNPWWLARPAVLAYLMVGVVCPTLIPRSLRAVARFSSFSVCMLFVLATAIAGLAAAAVAEGRVAPGVHLLPAAAALGPSPFQMLNNILTVISVSALAFTCQFNLLPIKHSLRGPSPNGMLRVLLLGLALCAPLYATVAIKGEHPGLGQGAKGERAGQLGRCLPGAAYPWWWGGLAWGYALFGQGVEGDVLKDLTVRFVSGLVPRTTALLVVYGVALSYTLCLLANFVLKVWAVREAVVEMVVQRPAAHLPPGPFYAITAALVALAYFISVLVPSIYGLLALVGATATVVFSYLFPSLLVLKGGSTGAQRAGAGALLALGAAMSLTAVYDHLTGQGLE
ncbi:hypothetical protein CHLNCDRAFT_51413 [Chlorella variabilis]|uniref:Amino acid transporter transmembrane domain-containing protein n=1 Tax=Chlorella variabilis TaxID=554065 RepID=E1ZAQ9_CHLVA|nr:hypothetical protein CHLNCDRAFT_51413 [Chlorella variabilis]EFN57306.1 hypothetical protein CHLNCDRAFT_51413 [Chlorella variabilis]|eukprot:XP_005849408.1 hypothetical protein CHLNCDRAFT_51413 [Chlorella variabilis]